METVLFEIEDQIAFITLNRPDKYNSVNRTMAIALQDALDECMRNPGVRVVYLTGTGKGFCAGQDLTEAIQPEAPSLRSIVHGHYNPIIKKIRNLEKPVVAAVSGVAAGAGANIALACDIVVAKESASFIQAFSKIGLIPDSGGTFFLPRYVGMQRAMALMMLGEKVMAREAMEMGMIYKCFPDETFKEESLAIVQRLAQMPTRALGYTKLALNASFSNDLSTQLTIEEDYQDACGKTADFDEGIAAFLEKRRPDFKGK